MEVQNKLIVWADDKISVPTIKYVGVEFIHSYFYLEKVESYYIEMLIYKN